MVALHSMMGYNYILALSLTLPRLNPFTNPRVPHDAPTPLHGLGLVHSVVIPRDMKPMYGPLLRA